MDIKDITEYTLLLVKPDGNEKELINIILSYLKEHGGLTEVHRNTFKLSLSQVSDTFIHIYNDRKYRSYMTRGPLTAVLLQGENAVEKLRILKKNIRKMYAIDVMENIIHSSEVGNEFDLQFRMFFPDLDINKYNLYADLYAKNVFPLNFDGFSAKMEHLQNGTTVKALAHIFSNDVFMNYLDNIIIFDQKKGFSKFTLIGLEYNTKVQDQNIKILGYYKICSLLELSKDHYRFFYNDINDLIHLIHGSGGIAFLSHSTNINNLQEESFEILAESGIKGGIVYHPQYTLEQTEFLRENIFKNNLITTGGSGGITQTGRYSVSYEIFNQLLKLLPGADKEYKNSHEEYNNIGMV
ncbi:nucleoside-diphosphate kinase [Paenibacillus motobuensis]